MLREKRAQRVPAVQRVSAVGAHEQRAARAARCAIRKARKSSVERSAQWMSSIASSDRRRLAETREHAQEQLEQTRLRERLARCWTARRRRTGLAELRHEPGELVAPGTEQRLERVGVELAREPAQRRPDRRVGELALGERDALAGEHARAATASAVALELVSRRLLPTPESPGQEDGRESPSARGRAHRAGRRAPARVHNSGLETRRGTARSSQGPPKRPSPPPAATDTAFYRALPAPANLSAGASLGAFAPP